MPSQEINNLFISLDYFMRAR